jgi:hypothetical protein
MLLNLSSRVLFLRPEFGYGLLFWVMISRFCGCLVGIFGLSALAHLTSTIVRIQEMLIFSNPLYDHTSTHRSQN